MATPLQQLRQAIISGNQITHDDTSIILDSGKIHLPRKLRSNFRSLHGRGEPYVLETIYFQYKFREYPYTQYFQTCKDRGVPHAFLIDKKDLLAYLSGAIDACPSITADTATDSNPPDAPPPDPLPVKERDPPIPKPTSTINDSERSRKRDRDQRVLDAAFTVIDWDYTSLRDKLATHLTSVKKSQSTDQSKKSNSQSNYDPRGDRYTNNEGRFWRENLGSDFGEMAIDMSGSFKAQASKPSANGNTSSAKPNPRSRTDAYQSNEPSHKKMKIDPQYRVPIIIVPSGDTTLISAMNAVEFIRDGHFLSEQDMKKQGIPWAQPARKTIRRKPGGNCSQADYHVVSNPNRLSSKEWDQVVAVVCSGQSWQFKKWPICEGTTQDFLRKVQGFYFHFEDIPPTGEVCQWPVKMMPVSRDQRHTDGSLQVQFWKSLDLFIGRKKAYLRY